MGKIMIFNSFYTPNILGGAERSVQMLAESLSAAGEHVIVVSTSDFDNERNLNGVKIYDVKIPNLYWGFYSKRQKSLPKLFWHVLDSYNIFSKKKIRRIIRKEKPDIIHTNNLTGFSPYVFKVAGEERIPIIHTIRDYYFMCSRSTMFRNGQNCMNQCMACKLLSLPKKKLSQRVHSVVGVSDFILRRHLSQGFFANAKTKKRVFNIFTPSNKRIKSVASANKIRFGFLGLLAESKGIKYAIESFIQVENPRIVFNIYGKGETPQYDLALRERYSSERIIFHGFKDTEQIYPDIDILIIPSLWHEPFPRTLIEAFSSGVPVLASNKGGIPEILTHGENGFIFDPDDRYSLTNLIKQVLANYGDLKRIQLNALEVSRQFSKEAIIEQYMATYFPAMPGEQR